MHLRVDDTDGPIHPNSAKSLSLGQARAWQTSSSVNAKEGEIRNLKTVFTFEHDGQTYDGQDHFGITGTGKAKRGACVRRLLKVGPFGQQLIPLMPQIMGVSWSLLLVIFTQALGPSLFFSQPLLTAG